MLQIGIDLGGTKIESVALDPMGVESFRMRIPTPKGDYQGTIAAIVGLVTKIERAIGYKTCVGVGIPGTISPLTSKVKNANSTWLIGKPFQEDLSGCRVHQFQDCPSDGRFTAAAFPDQTKSLSRRYRKRHVVYGLYIFRRS